MGVRDIFVLPGEMKDLMNKVAGAKKAAEANLIVLREVKARYAHGHARRHLDGIVS